MEKVWPKTVKNQWLFQCFLSILDPSVPGRCTYPLMTIYRACQAIRQHWSIRKPPALKRLQAAFFTKYLRKVLGF